MKLQKTKPVGLNLGLVFEQRHGTDTLLKVVVNALVETLADKGVITRQELLERFMMETRKFATKGRKSRK